MRVLWFILWCLSARLTHQEANRCNLDEICLQGLAACEGLCVCSFTLCICRLCVLCATMQSKPVWITQPLCLQVSMCWWWWRRCLCAFLCGKAVPPLFLLTFVVILGYFLPCRHITILHTHWFWVWSSSLVETQLILSYTATEAWWRDKMWCSTALRVNTKLKWNKL